MRTFVASPSLTVFPRPCPITEDNFNLYGLRSVIPNFRACLNVILDVSDSTHLDADQDLDACVMDLYGLIHARYIITKRGMDRMVRRGRV